jgi:hypothetical protein
MGDILVHPKKPHLPVGTLVRYVGDEDICDPNPLLLNAIGVITSAGWVLTPIRYAGQGHYSVKFDVDQDQRICLESEIEPVD